MKSKIVFLIAGVLAWALSSSTPWVNLTSFSLDVHYDFSPGGAVDLEINDEIKVLQGQRGQGTATATLSEAPTSFVYDFYPDDGYYLRTYSAGLDEDDVTSDQYYYIAAEFKEIH